MQHTASRARYCRHCDGFPAVAIDTGTLHSDGTRRTLRVVCRGCQGTGTVPLRPALDAAATAAFSRR
ncbi:hypothetical protein E4198_11945 [Streptomyces sp. RKND-216]|uniref:hypothetical protein n=1 Tax=Streptomyces sp. RKND-216 TaxID=2562581 RepID=UPI00109E0486|nr:hypothetical protein [Streptomyces sp. RKND-216]THA25340.1 hypothetical protein E4198_11945 [Streptomyces sp. RKND-216]